MYKYVHFNSLARIGMVLSRCGALVNSVNYRFQSTLHLFLFSENFMGEKMVQFPTKTNSQEGILIWGV